MKDITVLHAKRYGIYSCTPDTTLFDAARLMVKEDISGLVVLDGEGYLDGVITRTDLLRSAKAGTDWHTTKVSEFMNRQVITVAPQDQLSHVTQVLLENSIHRVVIVQKENNKLRPIGVISDADLIYHHIKEN